MFDSDDRTSRRAFLGTATVTFAGLAGCTSISGGSDDTSTITEQRTTTTERTTISTTTSPTSATQSTPEETQSTTTTTRQKQTETQTTVSEPDTLVYASDETSAFGVDLQGNPLIGSPNAPVDVYYWSDYQCPFCRKFEQNTFPKLVENYIKPGKVRFVLLEYVNIGKASKTAGRMAKCVWRQVREDNPNAFKRWHAAVFDAQKKPNSGWATKKNLLALTERIDGVDADAVESCLQKNAKSVAKSVADDKKMGKKKGVTVTPTFMFDDPTSNDAPSTIDGAQPYPLFEQTIEGVIQ